MTTPFDDSPVPRHPRLEAMIRAAREQPTPTVTVRFEDVQATAKRRSTWRVAALAAAAGVIATVAWAWPRLQPETQSDSLDGTPAIAVADELPAPPRSPSVPHLDPVQAPPASPGVLALEGGVTIERVGQGPVPTAELAEGRFRVRTADEPTSLTIGAQVLEISAASEVFVDTTQPEITFEVHRGRARWAQDVGRDDKRATPSATDLAAQAEAAILAQDHAEAARLLRKLVRSHPSSAAAKAGLIDLARAEKKLGNHARAHCAYASFLSRFPSDPRAPSVRSADDALGLSAVECRGLSPGGR